MCIFRVSFKTQDSIDGRIVGLAVCTIKGHGGSMAGNEGGEGSGGNMGGLG